MRYRIEKGKYLPFHNAVDTCIGTGRMGLALQKEYFEQLKLVQENIGFQYIRGHGLFCDDMAIYQEYTTGDGEIAAEYNFTYLDMVMDNYKELGLRPFLELGFMPYKLASGTQTVFYWKGNVTPPQKYSGWTNMVQATLHHLRKRYGVDEVLTWPIEIWNEPNLDVFWENADKEKYFKLFQETFMAVKAVDSRFKVGGPAICGIDDVSWLKDFLFFCREKKIALDFASRHHYCINLPKEEGHYGYCGLIDPEEGLLQLWTSRKIIDSFSEYKNMEFHLTEFNTSYSPKTPIHDTNLNAAYIAYLLSRLGEGYASYSYWTFGDIFEESGVPFTPFHGGFGLVANGCIPKPTFWTFVFFKHLKGKCVFKSDHAVIMQQDENIYNGVLWNPVWGNKEDVFSTVVECPVNINTEYCLMTKCVDERYCNPLKVWHDIGEPANLTREQKELLHNAAKPLIQTSLLHTKAELLEVEMEVAKNGVIYFELIPVDRKSDRGYSYERIFEI